MVILQFLHNIVNKIASFNGVETLRGALSSLGFTPINYENGAYMNERVILVSNIA